MGHKESPPKTTEKIPQVGNLLFEGSLEERAIIAKRNNITDPNQIEKMIFKSGQWSLEDRILDDGRFDGLEFDNDAQYRFGHH